MSDMVTPELRAAHPRAAWMSDTIYEATLRLIARHFNSMGQDKPSKPAPQRLTCPTMGRGCCWYVPNYTQQAGCTRPGPMCVKPVTAA